ncbi:hypothetical protein THAR02_07703 [Trichoderma harzianum]|uniref:Peptidase S8/S53 domain-containing protein n=1 Tax=Trichoderma harzianum TaxID=5544 RepID=A0A0G0A4T1_TRIHA|nr:hypothetical protein THAR02_07703 [Trichoderma harzianum]
MESEWAENSLANFRLWAAGLGVFAGGKASLDKRLSVDSLTGNLIKNLLILLKGLIDNCEALASGRLQDITDDDFSEQDTQEEQLEIAQSPPGAFSPWSTSSSTDYESEIESDFPLVNDSPLQTSKKEVEQILEELSRLAVAIRKSGNASRNQKADRLFKREDHEDFYKHLIVVVLGRGSQYGRQTYDIDPGLLSPIQERLILSNLRRRNRFQYAQTHSKKLAVDAASRQREVLGSQGTSAILAKDGIERGEDSEQQEQKSLTIEKQPQVQDKTDRRSTILTATSASAFEPITPAEFQRKPVSSQIAKTKVTLTTAKIEYPRPPPLKDGVEHFQCPCCYQVLPSMFHQGVQWKKHLARDVLPYTCIIADCPYPDRLYIDRSDWMAHVQNDHPPRWECLPCRNVKEMPLLFASVDEFLKHTKQDHGDSISEDLYSTLVDASTRPAPFEMTQCPLCDQEGQMDSKELIDHIAEHVHSFSLRSLPWPRSDSDKLNFDRYGYFDDRSDGQSDRNSSFSNSKRTSDDLGSLSSNVSIKQGEIDGLDFTSLNDLDPQWQQNFGNALLHRGFTQEYIQHYQHLIIIFIKIYKAQLQTEWNPEENASQEAEMLRRAQLIHDRLMGDTAAKFDGLENVPQSVMDEVQETTQHSPTKQQEVNLAGKKTPIDSSYYEGRTHGVSRGAAADFTNSHEDLDPDPRIKSFMEGFQQGNSAAKLAESSVNFRKIVNSIDDEMTEVRPVKIAIIDNGVDATLCILEERIANGTSFFPNKNINTGNYMDHYYPYYVELNTLNHGSLVATLVCKACPKVELYICRLDEKMSVRGEGRYFTMESATKLAVKWATEQGVDVICMSWTIEDNIKNEDAQKKFQDALATADDKNIIVVSSASDQGGNSTKTWPGESGRCIRIGASTETGDKSSHVHRGDMEFLFPGEEVPLDANEEYSSRTLLDGSSVATAIAAGTACLLLYLDRLAQKWGGFEQQSNSGEETDNWKETDEIWVPLKGRASMKKVFESMSIAGNKCPSLDMFIDQFDEFSFSETETAGARLRGILRPLKVINAQQDMKYITSYQ